ncbi:MAG: orotidine-5'-phosphate decarboxylase, partial [Planctomycetes bacterium]|nr:orotidine-5'-phosphate decarboxylase [Planctomycetota bacterium]
MSFASRLWKAVDKKNTPAMVGLDSRLDHLPEPFASRAQDGPVEAAAALVDYHRALIDILAEHIAVIKPQSAFFELLGPHGWQACGDAIAYAKDRGLIVLLDAKRGDIGSTSKAYAQALLGGGFEHAFPASDALTLNPYLGDDAAEPFLKIAKEQQAGLFFLVKTSNPGASLFQNHGSPPLAEIVAKQVHRWGEETRNDAGWSDIGAVVGATRPEELARFRKLMPHTPLLLPGFGFQGGTADGLSAAF